MKPAVLHLASRYEMSSAFDRDDTESIATSSASVCWMVMGMFGVVSEARPLGRATMQINHRGHRGKPEDIRQTKRRLILIDCLVFSVSSVVKPLALTFTIVSSAIH